MSVPTKRDLARMQSIVRNFANLKSPERQWVIDRLHDDHFHKLPVETPAYLFRPTPKDQETKGA